MGNFFSSLFGSNKTEEPSPPPTQPSQPSQPPVEPSQPPAEPAAPAPTGNFAQDLLNTQNQYRAKHGSPAMPLNDNLCKEAQKWADHIAQQDTLQHSQDRNGAGENLAWGSGGLTGEQVATMWYDEIKDYNFDNPGFAGNTGHFTQVVWKSSTEFGGAKATSASGGTFVVGRYLPAGNINTKDQFEENVLRAA